jgi:hypothetical protein
MQFNLIVSFFIALSILPLANGQVVKGSSQYQSSFDESLSIQKVSLLTSVDNVNGVYSRPIDEQLQSDINKDHQWDLVTSHVAGAVIKPEDLVANSSNVQSLASQLQADALIMAEARKDPKQLRLKLYLFSTKSGELIAEETSHPSQETTAVILQNISSMYSSLKAKVPYDAIVLSRTDNRVTLNAGSKDGVRPGSDLNAVKIISAKKHPKRNFIVQTNKSILGQVRVVKADDHISFADVVSEVEAGVIDKGAKITGVRRVDYGETQWTRTHTPPQQLLSKDNQTVFGKDSREWVTKTPPTFGKVGADLSLARFDNNLNLTDGGNLNSQILFYPRVSINGEIWLTPKFYSEASFSQGVGDASNPVGPPDTISSSLTQYRLAFGYNFMLRDEFFGPKFTIDIGLSNYRMYMDTVTQLGFTTLEYRSMPIGLGGYVPIDDSGNWAISGKAYFHLFPSLRESPFSSGANPNNSINQFLFNVEHKLSSRLRLKMGLEFLVLSTGFSGQGERTPPASNLSHRFTFFTTGIDYLF